MKQFKKRETSGFATISDVIAQVLLALGMPERYSEMAETIGQHAINGIRWMNMFAIRDIRVTYLKVDEMNCVNLPDDYIDYRKIGLIVRGQVWTLTLNENIALPRGIKCGKEIREVLNSGMSEDFAGAYGQVYYPSHYRNGVYVGGLYGIGGGFNKAYYRVDKEYNRIVFDGVIPKCEIVLEYQSSGISATSETIIPYVIVEPLKAWVHWQLIEHNPQITIGEKRRKQETFEMLYNAMEFKENMLTYDEINDAFFASSKQTPKR